MKRELRYFQHFLQHNPLFVFGLFIVLISLVLMALGPTLAPHDPMGTDPTSVLSPPSAKHWMGTDSVGMDIFSRVISAPRIDIYIAVVSTLIALVIGIPLGVVAGYFAATRGISGLLSEWLMRLMDVLQAFPVFILALVLVAAIGPSEQNIIAALAFLQFPPFLRLTRSAALTTREQPFVEAARCAGAPPFAIVFRHVLPNSLTPALVGTSVAIGQAMLITAGLSFVGAGVEVSRPEWGAMIAVGSRNMITGQWWPSVFPGLILGIIVFGYASVGDGLRNYLDPTKRL